MSKQFTCLLIEDDRDDQEIFLAALMDAYPRSKCWVAENCFQALDRMKSRLAPVPDYIFMDWNFNFKNAGSMGKLSSALGGRTFADTAKTSNDRNRYSRCFDRFFPFNKFNCNYSEVPSPPRFLLSRKSGG